MCETLVLVFGARQGHCDSGSSAPITLSGRYSWALGGAGVSVQQEGEPHMLCDVVSGKAVSRTAIARHMRAWRCL